MIKQTKQTTKGIILLGQTVGEYHGKKLAGQINRCAMAMQNLLVEFAESDKAVDRFDFWETDHILSIVHNRAHIVFNVSTCGTQIHR